LEGLEVCDLSQSENSLKTDAQYSVFHPSEVELGQVTDEILACVERAQPTVVACDGLSELRLLAQDPLRYRHQILALKHFFEERGITVLLLDDRSNPLRDIHPESVVGGNIILEKQLPSYGGASRRLFVSKVRGADFRDGYHDYEISQAGVVVHPRLVAAEHHEEFATEQFSSGIAGLDSLLGGGLAVGTTTLMLGPAGVGKSTVSMQYVAAALGRGVQAAVFTFDEVLRTLFDRSEKLCRNGIRQYAESGQLLARQVDPAELNPGSFADTVRQAVEAGTRVVVIDSLNGYTNAMPEARFVSTHLHELFSYLNQQGVVTIMVVAQHGLLEAETGSVDVSYLADTVVLFRYFETQGEIRQAISVFKKRTGPHERTVRQLFIREDGLSVGEPLSAFRGVLTGVPVYEPQNLD
jgi:circadian clock protein KaiC